MREENKITSLIREDVSVIVQNLLKLEIAIGARLVNKTENIVNQNFIYGLIISDVNKAFDEKNDFNPSRYLLDRVGTVDTSNILIIFRKNLSVLKQSYLAGWLQKEEIRTNIVLEIKCSVNRYQL